ncbi:hypothetical protein Tsubulata_014914 [Turnera subulata]|uniref:Alpha/beta hydrolase fold-3 domain-containing protein n=1 Tax=Turnera subulata TaxID=218843 RepID=A0A9Q0FYN0_9ROSI|nr:hypothetical protein Tsubulata_014914 [Turnera subulata]
MGDVGRGAEAGFGGDGTAGGGATWAGEVGNEVARADGFVLEMRALKFLFLQYTYTRLDGVTTIPVERTDWMWKAFLPEGFDRNHQVVRVFGPNGVDISGVRFPPTLLFIGGFDPLQDWQRRYREWLEKSGKEVHVVEYPNAVHGVTMPDIPESDLLFEEVKDFVKRQSSLE